MELKCADTGKAKVFTALKVDEGEYWTWRTQAIDEIAMANLSIQRKLTLLLKRIDGSKDETLKTITMSTLVSRDHLNSYRKLLYDLETNWGGNLRAYHWIEKFMMNTPKVKLNDQTSLSSTINKLDMYIKFAYEMKMESYLYDGVGGCKVQEHILTVTLAKAMYEDVMNNPTRYRNHPSTIDCLRDWLVGHLDSLLFAKSRVTNEKETKKNSFDKKYSKEKSSLYSTKGQKKDSKNYSAKGGKRSGSRRAFLGGAEGKSDSSSESSTVKGESSESDTESVGNEVDSCDSGSEYQGSYPSDGEELDPASSVLTAFAMLASHNNFKPSLCPCCADLKKGQKQHLLVNCDEFKALSVPGRYDMIRKLGRCYNCFFQHTANKCDKAPKCRECKGNHHKLLHNPAGKKSSGKDKRGKKPQKFKPKD